MGTTAAAAGAAGRDERKGSVYLKSLTLKGFKSFAQPTTFAFESGVTCVVGPNGSGKSNVVDALAWVMGEQGAKTLRGGKMDDVIFAGTSTKGPLGRAEVTLTIDNADGALPIDYSEVSIRRTLFRNGGSEYALNGEPCRLLDVQELLSDSGLGRQMHVIVGQGQLDAVLHASPEDRRGFIEEAAGILKHRRRKERTQRKLESMQANLTRLSDLAGELRRQLKPLGQQAEVAKEAQATQAEVRDAKARLYAHEILELRSALAELTAAEHDRVSQRMVAQHDLDQASARVAELELAQTVDSLAPARRTVFDLESAQERLRGLYTLAHQRRALVEAQADPHPATVPPEVSADQLAHAQDAVSATGRAAAAAESALADADLATKQVLAELDAADAVISAQRAALATHDLELSQLAGRSDAAASRLAAVRADLLRHAAALDESERRRQQAASRLAEAERDLPLESESDARDVELERSADAAAREAERVYESGREAVHTAERERDALVGRAEALSLALEHRDGSGALLGADLPGVHSIVADSIHVRAGWEVAVAAALGSLTDAVLVQDFPAGLRAIQHAANGDLGRVEVVLSDASEGAAAPALQLAGIPTATPARTVVDAPDGVLGLLHDVTLVEDLAQARELWPTFSAGNHNAVLVTRGGEVLNARVLRGGSGSRRSRLELAAERDRAAADSERLAAHSEALRAALTHQRTVMDQAKAAATSARAARRKRELERVARREHLQRLRMSVEATTAEHNRLRATQAVSAAAVKQAEIAAAEARAEVDAAQARPRPVVDSTDRDRLRSAAEAARQRELAARLAQQSAAEQVRAAKAAVAALARQQETARLAAEQTAQRAESLRRQRDSAAAVAAALPALLDSAARSLAEAQHELAVGEARRAAQVDEFRHLRGTEAELRERLHALTESVHGLELHSYERRLHLSSLLERAAADIGLDENALVAEYGPADPERPFEREREQARLQAAERALAQLGRVNPLALEEYVALEQRHRFLTEQLTDLSNTRRDLMSIIAEIDERMQDTFLAAFEDTRAAFAEVFPVLFPGGTGRIQLVDPDAPLTTGIEVTVRPAGKKIERLSLLSGGERSLAAVALLIAIFKARPSPFYIMDEVEAALDDANLGRLLTIFQELRRSSQLIVITHQKRTMDIADVLYGISMRQDGVSAVVGQRVGHGQEPAEPPAAVAPVA